MFLSIVYSMRRTCLWPGDYRLEVLVPEFEHWPMTNRGEPYNMVTSTTLESSAAHLSAKADVLVIERDDSLRRLLTTALSDEGYEVRSAKQGLAALSKAEGFSPDVVVLSCSLHGLTGEDTMTVLRSAHPGVPAVFLASNAGYKARLREDTGNFVIEMPFWPDELIAEVEHALGARETL